MNLQNKFIFLLFVMILISCKPLRNNDSKTRIVQILKEEAGERKLEILKLEIIDSSLVDNHIKDLDIIRHNKEYRQNLKRIIKLKKRKVKLTKYDLEEYDLGFLSHEQLNEKEELEDKINKLLISISELKEELEKINKRITKRIINSSNYTYDSLILISYYLECQIEKTIITDTVKIYFTKKYDDYLCLKNIFFGINDGQQTTTHNNR